MPITINHSPSPHVLGQAANLIGQGERDRYLQKLALQQQAMDLNERQFAEQQSQNAFRNDLAAGQFAQQQYQFEEQLYQRAMDAERARQASLASQGMRQQGALQQLGLQGMQREQALQYGLLEQQLQNQARLEQEGLQQGGLMQRQRMTLDRQADMQRRSHVNRQMESDWASIQRVLPELDSAEQQELIAQFQDRYSAAGMPMPMEMPQNETPEDMDPIAMAERFRQENPGVPFMVTPDGEVQVPRGWSYQASPVYHERQMEMEQMKAEFKQQQDQAKAEQQATDQLEQEFRDFMAEEDELEKQRIEFMQKAREEGETDVAYRRRQSFSKFPPPMVMSREVWEKLPPGTRYRNPLGQLLIKK